MIDTIKYFNQIEDDLAFPNATVLCIAKVGNTKFVGWNSEKTSPSFIREYPCGETSCERHAEMHILRQIPRGSNPKSVKIFVFRVKKDGELSMAKPCAHCQERLSKFGLHPSNIYFTNWNGNWEKLRSFDE